MEIAVTWWCHLIGIAVALGIVGGVTALVVGSMLVLIISAIVALFVGYELSDWGDGSIGLGARRAIELLLLSLPVALAALAVNALFGKVALPSLASSWSRPSGSPSVLSFGVRSAGPK